MFDASFKRNVVRILLIALTAFYCTVPLFTHYGVPSAQDMIFHVFQADQFNHVLHEGVLYPRWIADFNNGYGSPTFVFYSPLSYYFVSAIMFLTNSLIASMIIAIWFSFFLSGIAMFIATKKMFGGSGNPLPALFYQIIPFHLFDLYVRGTFAELFAYIWFPLIILFLYQTIKSRNRTSAIGLSLSYTGLILTHMVSGFIFSLVIGAYLIYNYFLLEKKKTLLQPIVSLVIGLGLSSIYLIPIVFERKFVQIDYIVTSGVGNYKENFLFTIDKFQSGLERFYLPLHTIVVLEVILFLFIVLLIRKNRQVLSDRPQQHFFIFLSIFAFFLTIPLSRPVWDIVPGFPFLQFPWRWVPMMEVSLCFLIGLIFSLDSISMIRSSRLKRLFIYCLIIFSLSSLVIVSKSKIVPDRVVNDFLAYENISKLYESYEYTPRWVTDIKEILSEERIEHVSVISGEAEIHVAEWNAEKRVITIKAPEKAVLRIATFYYPGWKAEINGNSIPIRIEKDTGAMLVDIPEGNYTLELSFRDTPLRYYAKLISIVFFFFMILVLFYKKNKRTH
jgi:uncharacterized membrane protein